MILRGNNKRVLFSRAPDYERFISYLGDAITRSRVEVHAAMLMTNHVHLVVTPLEQDSLAKFVKPMAQRYAQYRNRQRGGSGRLFDARFDSEPIESEAHLASTLAYVDLNPVRAGMQEDVRVHRWSTYGCHTGCARGFPSAYWTPSAWYLALGATTDERARRYAEWVADVRARDARPAQAGNFDRKEERARRAPEARRPNRSRAT